jgi:hypothetical protein
MLHVSRETNQILGDRFLYYARRMREFRWEDDCRSQIRRNVHPSVFELWRSAGDLSHTFPRLRKLKFDMRVKDATDLLYILDMVHSQITHLEIIDMASADIPLLSFAALDRPRALASAAACTHLESLIWTVGITGWNHFEPYTFCNLLRDRFLHSSRNLVNIDLQWASCHWSDLLHLAQCPRLRRLTWKMPEVMQGQDNILETLEVDRFAELRILHVVFWSHPEGMISDVMRVFEPAHQLEEFIILQRSVLSFSDLCIMFDRIGKIFRHVTTLMAHPRINDMTYNEVISAEDSWTLLSSLRGFSSLQRVFVAGITFTLSSTHVVRLLTSLPQIQKFDIPTLDHNFQEEAYLSPASLAEILKACPLIEDMSIVGLSLSFVAFPQDFPTHHKLVNVQMHHLPADMQCLHLALRTAFPHMRGVLNASRGCSEEEEKRIRELNDLFWAE